jgi:sulfate permease, SulP family
MRKKTLSRDTLAGLINAVVSVPDGLASAALAGVNPVYGLYTSVAAPLGGSPLVSAQLMQIATTSAAALLAGQAVVAYPAERRAEAIFLLAILSGLLLAMFGLLRLGRLVRFVSHAVMTGFLAGVAVVLILDQLAPLTGIAARGRNPVAELANLVANAGRLDPPTVVVGVLALGLAFGLGRTRFATWSSLVALLVPTILVVLTGWVTVQQVEDVSPIPRGFPLPALPGLDLLSPELLASAFALTVVIAVQGVGVSQTVENPDGRPVDPSRDLLAQGAANVASGLFSGIPAGGSVGQTALNVAVGARSRWAGILSGVWMLVIVLLVPGLVGLVPMTALAALMIVAGLGALDLREARSIWATGGAARWAILVTFAATLVLSVPVAVGIGVLLSLGLHLASESDVTVRALVRLPDGRFKEENPPRRLPSEEVTVLHVQGSLFFAGARRLEEALPSPEGAVRPALVLRLRGRTRIGATLIEVLDSYADALEAVGGRLYLSGVDGAVQAQLRRTGKLELEREVRVVPATSILGESTAQALASASAWLGRARAAPPRTGAE